MQKNKNLKSLNTFGIEVFAKEYIELNNFEESVLFFKEHDLSETNYLILGGGSNLLLTEDFNGLVIKNQIKGIEIIKEDENEILLKVGAGENWHSFVMYCVDKEYAGIENLSLIPGNIGASPMQNIGAYGVEVKEVITEVETVQIANGEKVTFTNEECAFDYRSSIFKTSHKDQFFISAVTFKLNKKPSFKIDYGAIKNQLAEDDITEENLSIKAVSDAVIKIRQSKLPDPKEIGNSGSFFKNPIIKTIVYTELKKRYKDMPAYELSEGNFKLAAGWLIEKTGWKGYTEGDYGVHKNQALVLVNYGNATGLEVYDLSERIVLSVKKKFGITLEREVNII